MAVETVVARADDGSVLLEIEVPLSIAFVDGQAVDPFPTDCLVKRLRHADVQREDVWALRVGKELRTRGRVIDLAYIPVFVPGATVGAYVAQANARWPPRDAWQAIFEDTLQPAGIDLRRMYVPACLPTRLVHPDPTFTGHEPFVMCGVTARLADGTSLDWEARWVGHPSS
jgi:hypothetical protein